MNKEIFREYDIRGIVDQDLTVEVVRNIGKGFGTYFRQLGYQTLSLGRDNRLSSEKFSLALIEGLMSTGCEVINIGLVPTPLLYFSIHKLKTQGGIMITGSHNPAEFNGFKLCIGKRSIHGKNIQEIRKIIEEKKFISDSGKISEAIIIPDYLEMIRGKIKLKKKLKVIVDAGNGTASWLAPKLLKDLGCETTELFCESDGRFPNHFPDPTVKKNLEALISKVKIEKSDIGIAYDGDADRLGVVDNRGEIIWGDQLLIIFAREILKRKNKAKIIFEVKCSQNLSDDILQNGGIPIMWTTGHSLIKEKMEVEKAELAGEMSGHFFFADGYFGFDDGIYASLRLLQILSESNLSLSEMLSNLPTTFSTPEIRVDCADSIKFSIIEKLKKHFKEKYETIDIDGVRVLFPEGWGLVRASNTQAILVLRFEAKSQESLIQIQDIFQTALNVFGIKIN